MSLKNELKDMRDEMRKMKDNNPESKMGKMIRKLMD